MRTIYISLLVLLGMMNCGQQAGKQCASHSETDAHTFPTVNEEKINGVNFTAPNVQIDKSFMESIK